VEDLSLAFDIW